MKRGYFPIHFSQNRKNLGYGDESKKKKKLKGDTASRRLKGHIGQSLYESSYTPEDRCQKRGLKASGTTERWIRSHTTGCEVGGDIVKSPSG